jgi:O-antigen/teichoic acid export membrane protein
VYTAWKVGGLFFMVSPAVSSALFAEGSHVSEGINRKVRTSALVTASLLVPLMAGFALFGRPVLALFGPDYASHGIALLLVLVVSAVPDAVTNVYISVLRIQDRLRLAAVLNCGAAVLAIALAWWLLPILGLLGAGVAWLAAQAAGSLVVLADVLYQRRRRAGRALARCD